MELVMNKLKTYSSLVMFGHTIFALPFAYLALFLAAGGWPDVVDFFWITIAMIGARNGANAWNRIADLRIDRENPRTAGRELPSGKVDKMEVVFLTAFCFLLLILAAYHLDPLALKLTPLAILFVCFYSYTKRFTWLCHYFLGAACALAPMGTWIAVRGEITPGIIILSTIHCLWVAGFDIIYATQDYDFDRNYNVRSIPARFGVKKALKIALFTHLAALLLMFVLPVFFSLGLIYIIGVLAVTGLIIYEHRLVSPEDLSQVTIASYSINQIISPVFFLAAVIDLVF